MSSPAEYDVDEGRPGRRTRVRERPGRARPASRVDPETPPDLPGCAVSPVRAPHAALSASPGVSCRNIENPSKPAQRARSPCDPGDCSATSGRSRFAAAVPAADQRAYPVNGGACWSKQFYPAQRRPGCADYAVLASSMRATVCQSNPAFRSHLRQYRQRGAGPSPSRKVLGKCRDAPAAVNSVSSFQASRSPFDAAAPLQHAARSRSPASRPSRSMPQCRSMSTAPRVSTSSRLMLVASGFETNPDSISTLAAVTRSSGSTRRSRS